jgi:hypothetical protein
MVKEGKVKKITNLKDFLEFKGRSDLLNKITSKNYAPDKKPGHQDEISSLDNGNCSKSRRLLD